MKGVNLDKAECIAFSLLNGENLEQRVAKLVKSVFNKDVATYRSKISKGILMRCEGKPIAEFFKRHCYSTNNFNARNKAIPEWAMYLPANSQHAILRGLWEGDGSAITEKNHYAVFMYYTASEMLAYQLRMLLMRSGIYSSLLRQIWVSPRGNHAHRLGYSQRVSGKQMESLARILGKEYLLKQKKPKFQRFQLSNGYLLAPIREIKTYDYTGKVYNLEVEEDNSYTVEGVAVHNCAQARSLGFKAYVDTSIICIHETGAKVTMKGLEPKI